MNKEAQSDKVVDYLNSLPAPQEELNEEISTMILEIISGMRSENLLGSKGKESAIELVLSGSTYYCLLDEEQQLKKVFKKC